MPSMSAEPKLRPLSQIQTAQGKEKEGSVRGPGSWPRRADRGVAVGAAQRMANPGGGPVWIVGGGCWVLLLSSSVGTKSWKSVLHCLSRLLYCTGSTTMPARMPVHEPRHRASNFAIQEFPTPVEHRLTQESRVKVRNGAGKPGDSLVRLSRSKRRVPLPLDTCAEKR